MENLDDLKKSKKETPRYHLKNARVFVSPGGLHYTDALDPVEEIST